MEQKFSWSKYARWFSLAGVLRFAAALAMLIYAVGIWRDLAARPDMEARFDPWIREAAQRHALPPSLVKAVIRQESNFRPWAIGRAGEIGLMQVTRMAVADWERYSGRRCPYNGMIRDPRLNIEIGTWYLSQAFSRWQEYRDVEVLALAQYNAGASRARKWAPEDIRESVLDRVSIQSTRDYIKGVMEYREGYIQKQGRLP